MSNNIENEQQEQPTKQPAPPAPRGGGDVSGKGISDTPDSREGGGSGDAGGAGDRSDPGDE